MANPYSIFLMSQLLVAHGIIDKDEDYDTMWAEAQTLLQQFEESKFNTDMKSEIDCMTDFCIDFKNSMLKPIIEPSDNVIDGIISKLDTYGRDYDRREYGLPYGNPHIENMRNIIKEQLGM
jgi:hypothetical protein